MLNWLTSLQINMYKMSYHEYGNEWQQNYSQHPAAVTHPWQWSLSRWVFLIMMPNYRPCIYTCCKCDLHFCAHDKWQIVHLHLCLLCQPAISILLPVYWHCAYYKQNRDPLIKTLFCCPTSGHPMKIMITRTHKGNTIHFPVVVLTLIGSSNIKRQDKEEDCKWCISVNYAQF